MKRPIKSTKTKSVQEQSQVPTVTPSAKKSAHDHTIFGVHPEHQAHVNRLQHTDPELWHRIRSWN
jgi:hypothetical protein